MRQRIEQLINGRFEYEAVMPLLSEKEIIVLVKPGEGKRGFFELSAGDEKRLKGFVYSSDPRMACDPQQFQGTSCRLTYQADAEGLKDGDNLTGCFTLCTDHGELTLPWTIQVRERPDAAEKKIGTGKPDLTELARVARTDMAEAAAYFAGPEFTGALRSADPVRAVLQKSLIDNDGPLQALEEFLIDSGLKEPVDIDIEETAVHMPRPDRSVRQILTLRRDGWGYLEAEISSDSRFLRPAKTSLTSLDFVGDQYRLEYIVDTNFLHAGNNFGRISIRTSYRTISFDVVVEGGADDADHRNLRVQRLMRRKLLSLYMDLRTRRIEMQAWIDRSVTVIGSYRRAGGTDVFADLFLVQMYYADGKKMKGKRMLQELGRQMYRFENNEQYAYYLYLTTFFDRDANYVNQVEAQIEKMFLQKRDSWILQWILLYLQERYLHDDSAKMNAIEQQVRYGCCSPILYLEAVTILRKNPYLLRKLGLFEQKLLLFAGKWNLLTEELSAQVSNLMLPGMTFDRKIYRILCDCYDTAPSRDLLTAICQYLIDGQKKETEYFRWYALGVAKELRMNGLYDYYMETMDEVSIEKMPQIIRMYFSYNNTLNYHRKAAIYRNISDNRESVPAVFRSARSGIEHFIIEQLELGRVDSNLAVLYERFLTRRLLGDLLAQQLVKVLFTFRITCKNPLMTSVILTHDCLRKEEIIPLENGVAHVRIYSEHAKICLADERGRRYTSSSLYLAERYIDSPLLLSYCRELCPDNAGLVIYTCSSDAAITPETLPYYVRASRMDMFRGWFLRSVRRKALRYYDRHPEEESLYDFLRSIRYSEYIGAGKRELLTLLTREGLYEEAFHMLETYGIEDVDPACLVRICSQNVLLREYDEDPLLLAYCFTCFSRGKYDDNILEYLVSWYDGPIEEMKRLWECAHESSDDTMTLEEKILSVYLFTGCGGDNTEQIFWSYYSKLGRKRLCTAYVNRKSYEYLVKNLPVNSTVFHWIRQALQDGTELEDVCLLALLQYDSGIDALDEDEEATVTRLLDQFNERGIRFDFFRKFPERLRVRCQLEDRVFLEYVANPAHTAMVCMRSAGSGDPYEKEPLKNMFEGIFVKEFVLFDGEEIECYIEEYDGENLVRKTDRRILSARLSEDAPADRYGMLCRMSRKAADHPDEAEALLREDMENFAQLDHLTREVFTLL